jgi:hypothetical protein
MSLRERTRPGLGLIEPVKNPKAPGEARGGGGLGPDDTRMFTIFQATDTSLRQAVSLSSWLQVRTSKDADLGNATSWHDRDQMHFGGATAIR